MLKDYDVIEHENLTEFLALVEDARKTAPPRDPRSESAANLALLPEHVSTDPLNRKGRHV